MERHRHIVVVLPHPDDESMIAGTLAAHIQQGAKMTYVCLTLGEMGRNMGNPAFANRVTLPQIRKQELEEACRRIGIQDVRMWGYHDKMVEFEEQGELSIKIEQLLSDLQPSLVYTFYPGHGVHPDHDATGAAVIEAVKRMPSHSRPKVYCVAITPNRRKALGAPTIVNDISHYVDQKIHAIKAHQSQSQMLLESLKKEDAADTGKHSTEVFWEYSF
ncbi:bacillithiol biosynthesis deacetylase BshB2 [Paenibacillus sp. SC116]|uniref:bacillithiol biosynthesis deacetylase BshB2 n=1 Tax=Paenibacillus sp. SC116 TaxID=2968986 RepID=UPI00215A43EA|nr:bacillithiol biosynthesis deacetylase BshB2 [Paenibacillus sp. SC116]MCR8842683.1 bacillithiol biosynthesis deacetylase BshB2 [Paenibacillus sp. SC116]